MEKLKLLLLAIPLSVVMIGCEKDPVLSTESTSPIEINGDTTVCDNPGWAAFLLINSALFGPGDSIRFGGIGYPNYWAAHESQSIRIWLSDTGTAFIYIKHETDIDSISVRFKPCWYTLLIPDAFTPNGDGLNDKWKPTHNRISYMEWEIRNEHNVLVHTSLSGLKDGWDGTFQGESAPVGMYQYHLNFTTWGGEHLERHGWIELYR